METTALNTPRAKIAEFCKRNHNPEAVSLRLRVARGGVAGQRRGVRAPAATPGFFGLARMERELSEILGGRKVDLRTPGELSRYFRDQVLAQAKVQYAER